MRSKILLALASERSCSVPKSSISVFSCGLAPDGTRASMMAITIMPATIAMAATAEACTGDVVSEMYWVDLGKISTKER